MLTSMNRDGGRKGLRRAAVLAAALAAGAVSVLSAPAALAAVNAGAVQLLAPPAGQPLTGGGSSTAFTMTPPAGAACSGDSAAGGYRVQSFMVPSTVDPATLTFDAFGPIPAGSGAAYRQPMFSSVGSTPFVNRTTGTGTGALSSLPSFSFAFLPDATRTFLPAGTYTIGYACTLGPAGPTQLDRYWTTKINILASATDPLGITWTPGTTPPPPPPPSMPTVTSYSTLLARPGAVVTVKGTNLDSATAATLNGVSLAPITVLTSTAINVTLPASGVSSGPIRVTNPAGTSTNTNVLTVTAAPTQVSAGTSHSCARLADGTVRCWGLNTNGRLGDGTTTQRTSPVTVLSAAATPLAGVVSVSAGGSHSCAVLTSGAVRCWGNNANGQLGTGLTTSLSFASTNVVGISTATQVSAGTSHSCARLADGTVRCWGLNTNGRLGDGTTTQRTSPVTVLSAAATPLAGVVSVSAGGSHSCAVLTSGAVRCWGNNANGQLGTGLTTSLSFASTIATGIASGVNVSAGGSHTLLVSTSSVLSSVVNAMGLNTNGQLGDGSVTQRTAPTQLVL